MCMYALLETINQYNGKRKRKIVAALHSSTSQTDERVWTWRVVCAHSIFFFSSFVLCSLGRTFEWAKNDYSLLFYHKEIELETDVTSVSTNGMLVKKKNVTSIIEITKYFLIEIIIIICLFIYYFINQFRRFLFVLQESLKISTHFLFYSVK
jgi:hypothetical protein